jgi:hypothetical protein
MLFNADDPYYCGLRARVPNFVKANKANRIVDNNSNYISSKDLNKLMKEKEQKRVAPASAMSNFHQMRGNGSLYPHHLPANQPYSMWHAKSYESGIGKIYFCFHYFFSRFIDTLIKNLFSVLFSSSDSEESPYQIYGRMPLPTRGYVPTPRMYIGEWD